MWSTNVHLSAFIVCSFAASGSLRVFFFFMAYIFPYLHIFNCLQRVPTATMERAILQAANSPCISPAITWLVFKTWSSRRTQCLRKTGLCGKESLKRTHRFYSDWPISSHIYTYSFIPLVSRPWIQRNWEFLSFPVYLWCSPVLRGNHCAWE